MHKHYHDLNLNPITHSLKDTDPASALKAIPTSRDFADNGRTKQYTFPSDVTDGIAPFEVLSLFLHLPLVHPVFSRPSAARRLRMFVSTSPKQPGGVGALSGQTSSALSEFFSYASHSVRDQIPPNI